MTAIALPKTELDPTATDAKDDAAAPEPPKRATSSSRGLARRAVSVVLIFAVVAGFAVWLFNGPLGDVWFSVHQRGEAKAIKAGASHIAVGEPFATLQIPTIGVNVIVVQGDGADELRGAPGHRITSPAPGKRGNSVIFGHLATWGSPFQHLRTLHRGDFVAVKPRSTGKVVVFKVTNIARVAADDERLLAPSNDHRLTMVTGTAGFNSTERTVVTAISGTPGKLRRVPAGADTGPEPQPILGSTLAIALVAFAMAAVSAVALRRRGYGALAIGVIVVSLMAAGSLATLMTLEGLLPPLR